ncbi:MAG: pantetheine-phosphate adenylyltransferase [Bacteroidetes bacterium]|jgi:pantetheine-phosphate adenylyltransferase|nr:pantetheine-phosphate adenylyltransferase [Bacteroidota bacterium]
METRIAVFAGTFDPITNGHVDVIKRSLPLFDKIVIAIGENTKKQTLFDTDKRLSWIREIFSAEPKISVSSYSGLTVDFCKEVGAGYILRGLRNGSDYDYEAHIAQLNKELNPTIETVFVITSPEVSYISSSLVRDLIIYKGDYTRFVPTQVRA